MVYELIKDSWNFINPKNMLEVMLHVPSKIVWGISLLMFKELPPPTSRNMISFIQLFTSYIVFKIFSHTWYSYKSDTDKSFANVISAGCSAFIY